MLGKTMGKDEDSLYRKALVEGRDTCNGERLTLWVYQHVQRTRCSLYLGRKLEKNGFGVQYGKKGHQDITIPKTKKEQEHGWDSDTK